MKRHTTILFLSIFFSYNCFAQLYTPYTFTNFETKWTHHAYNEDLLDEELNGFHLEDIVYIDSSIYAVYGISSINWYFNGFLLEKLDAETGVLLWDYTTFQKGTFDRDTPSKISLKEDGTLVVSSFREINETPSNTIWYDSQMNNWIFDTDTGELLETLTTIDGDSNHVPMWMNFNPIYNNIIHSIVNEDNDSYQYLLSTLQYENIKILDYRLNELGHLINKDSVFLPLKHQYVNQSYTLRLNNNKIFNYRESSNPNNPIDSFNIEITHLDSNLNILYTKNISDDFLGEDHSLFQVNESRFAVIQLGDKIFEDEPYRYTTLYTYDIDGNLLEEVPLERPDGSPLYSKRWFNILPIEELNQTLLVAFNTTETEAYWEWFLTTPNGGVESIGKTVFENIQEEFAWSFFNKPYMKYIGNNKVLLHARHLSVDESSNITETDIPSLSLISLDKLRTTVSVDSPDLPVESIVYPNPAHSEIIIKENSKYQKYELFNVSGKLVNSGTLQDDKININMLSNGYYILKLYNEKNQVDVQKIVIQR